MASRKRKSAETPRGYVHRVLGPMTASKEYRDYFLLGRTYVEKTLATTDGIFNCIYRYNDPLAKTGLDATVILYTGIDDGCGVFKSNTRSQKYKPALIYIPLEIVPYVYEVLDQLVTRFQFVEILDGTNICVTPDDLPLTCGKHKNMFATQILSFFEQSNITHFTVMNAVERFNRLPIYKRDFWGPHCELGIKVLGTIHQYIYTSEIKDAPWSLKQWSSSPWPLRTLEPKKKTERARATQPIVPNIALNKPVIDKEDEFNRKLLEKMESLERNIDVLAQRANIKKKIKREVKSEFVDLVSEGETESQTSSEFTSPDSEFEGFNLPQQSPLLGLTNLPQDSETDKFFA